MIELSAHFDGLDIAAFLCFAAAWLGYAFYARSERRSDRSLLAATNRYRAEWMRQMLARENRSVDVIVIGNLMRSSTFSANTTIFIIAGLLGILGYHEKIGMVISNIPFARPMTPEAWEAKISLLIVIFIYAFFKYTWSLRQQNYTNIFVAAAPPYDQPQPQAEDLVRKGTFLAGNAAEHFNYGLRAYYFGLAVLGWFVHPLLFIFCTVWVVAVIHRREFRSHTLKNLLS